MLGSAGSAGRGCATDGNQIFRLSIPVVLRFRRRGSVDLRLLPVERRGVQHIVGLTPAVGRYAGGVWGMCQLGVWVRE